MKSYLQTNILSSEFQFRQKMAALPFQSFNLGYFLQKQIRLPGCLSCLQIAVYIDISEFLCTSDYHTSHHKIKGIYVPQNPGWDLNCCALYWMLYSISKYASSKNYPSDSLSALLPVLLVIMMDFLDFRAAILIKI